MRVESLCLLPLSSLGSYFSFFACLFGISLRIPWDEPNQFSSFQETFTWKEREKRGSTLE